MPLPENPRTFTRTPNPMPELRQDPVVKRWVIISTERTRRPNDFTDHNNHLPVATVDPLSEGNEHLTPPAIYAVRDKGTQANKPGWRYQVRPNQFAVLCVEGMHNS